MKNYSSNLKTFLIRWTTPQKYTSEDGIKYWQDRLLLLFLVAGTVFGFFVYIPSVALCIKEKLWSVAAVDTIIYIWIIILFFKRSIPFAVRAGTIVFLAYILGMTLLLTIGPFGGGPVWLFAFPVIAALFIGLRASVAALVINAGTIIVLGILLSSGYLEWDNYIINAAEKWTVVGLNFILLNSIVAISVGVVSRGLETLLEQKKSTLRSLQQKHGELLESNRQLKDEIYERNRLEKQLRHAQKMEAIGTLAGGVAHDLNNVLSGIVSYPELLLLDLPENSPLKKPIAIIQESGKKASAIVQDLLTLARRGVVVTDVINLNNIIDDYLESPECKKLREFHPDVEIKSDFEANLPNIEGSPVHLSKAVMNLVNNAAEAMPEGGNIFISTKSGYLDKPIRGYDDVKEGDYIILTIADTGTGIPPGDIGKIFEPFYTKKVMGRSGTGLGMAVVWGTVKDHKGYIDIQSTEGTAGPSCPSARDDGHGTTFTLYFPVTGKEIKEKEKAVSMEEYMGKGESILVVDDVEDQRKIASRILTKLNYSVTSASSGEKALDYLKNNSADLLVLDMIMDPGIDGLETFKQILELHPGQKAIIASGFSETDKVREAQRLGAGKYIKKPYTLENIGFAVKGELKK